MFMANKLELADGQKEAQVQRLRLPCSVVYHFTSAGQCSVYFFFQVWPVKFMLDGVNHASFCSVSILSGVMACVYDVHL